MTFPKPPADTRGTLVEHLPVHTVTFDLGSTPPPSELRLFTGFFGPATAATNTGPIILAVSFTVNAPGCSFVGYSPWCCNSGQDTTPVVLALWQLTNFGAGTLIPAATVTSGTLTQGAYTDTFLPAAVPLTAGTTYLAQMGMSNGVPLFANFWSSGGPGYNGIVNQQLVGYSDQGASRPVPFGQPQCCFAPGVNDPTVTVCQAADSSFNAYLDVLVSG